MMSNEIDVVDELLEGYKLSNADYKEETTQKPDIDEEYSLLYGQIDLPQIGRAKSEAEPHLIEAGQWGYFDTKSLMFTEDVTQFTQEAFRDVLRIMTWMGADEVFMQDSEPLMMKLQNEVWPMTGKRFSIDELDDVIGQVSNTGVPSRIRSGSSEPFAFSVPWINKEGDVGNIRFRGNGTRTIGLKGSTDGVTYAIRKLGDKIPTLDQLKVQQAIRDIAFPKSGLVLTVGETGSGKTTLDSSFLEHIITSKREVIVTYEYPVEFDLRNIPNRLSIVGQTDLTSCLDSNYGEACRDGMRRNGDTLKIGEVRDEDSASGVLNLVQSGHRVYSTFHAGSPMEVFSRIMDYFPHEQQHKTRHALINALQAIICVKLVPTKDNKRVQIRGYLGFNRQIRKILNSVSAENFMRTLEEVYEKYGWTMARDLKTYRDQIDDETFEEYLHLFGDEEVIDEVEHA